MRYIIGIDLGTTNSAVAFVDTQHPTLAVQLFSIPQLTQSGKVESLSTLPSFCYLISPQEWAKGSLKLPWKEENATFVGQFAKSHGARVPTRLVQSAKSWLSHVAANRRDKILPLEAADPSQRLSPVEASSKYLMHIRDAWNASMAKGNSELELEEQDIVLTVPASFDETARLLTIESARQAGFLHLTLLEEPQAAFYSWISQHEKKWKEHFQANETILVCDVGGGTTDFSLIEIQDKEGELVFQRMAVGNHLLLGGDNMDSALAHYVENKLREEHSTVLDTQWLQLLAEARDAKEKLLSSEVKPGTLHSVALQGSGASVVKGSLGTSVSKEEVENLMLAGFFGDYTLEEALHLRKSRGMRSMGLPYEDEPSVTKHLAHFLKQAGWIDKGKKIDYVLYNGGTLKPVIFQHAIEQNLNSWFSNAHVRRLSSISLDLAVARGAAYYGKVKRGYGTAIHGGLPRSYYLKIDVKDGSGCLESQALTLLTRGTREGTIFQPEQVFSLRPNQPISFTLLTSHTRIDDQKGKLIRIDPDEMQALPPIQTILRFGKKKINASEKDSIPVKLGIQLTEIGTLALWLESQVSEHEWNLEFQVASATGHEAPATLNYRSSIKEETFEKGYFDEVKTWLKSCFQANASHKPGQIMEQLEKQIGKPRNAWGLPLLRELWEPLLEVASKRKISLAHEARWWNLAGFFLRPGFGFPLDDFRLKELWKIALSDMKAIKDVECFIQMCICFRRVAGGLNKGQQIQLASELIGSILDKKTGKVEVKRKADVYVYSEKLRALASLERLEVGYKTRLGDALVERLLHLSQAGYDYWALGRIGARHLVYGSAGQVIPKETCSKWIEKLLKLPCQDENRESLIFVFQQLARKTHQRELNLSEELIQKILQKYPDAGLEKWLLEEHVVSSDEQEQIFGDQLPAGIFLDENSFSKSST